MRRSVLGWLIVSTVVWFTFGLTSFPNPLITVGMASPLIFVCVANLIREFIALKNWDLVLVRCGREDTPFSYSPRNFKIFIGAYIEQIWPIRPSVVHGDLTVLLLNRKNPARSLPLGAVNFLDAAALEQKWLDYSNERFIGVHASTRR